MRRILHCSAFILLFIVTSPSMGVAQTENEHLLPRFPTPKELQLQNTLSAPNPLLESGITDPPALPVRAMAEWEELQALVVNWNPSSTSASQLDILAEIVKNAKSECRVIICCPSANSINSAKSRLTSHGVDFSSNVDFVIAPSNSIWVRDYGPNCVYANDVDSLFFVDWRYNRTSRPQDDSIATTLAPYLGVPLYRTLAVPTDLVNTGGNFMSDGMGTAFASKLILSENAPGNPYNASAKTEGQINDIFANFMGIERYIKMETLPYDEIHHIDMHMKLINEETLLVGAYPDGVADGPQIEANLQYVLSNFKSSFGTPYKVVRIQMPPQNSLYPDNGGDYLTYANAVFVNKTVLLPFYKEEFDTTARRIWQEALPGYNIVGINCNAIIHSLGAIHCITKEIGVADPLRIVHQQLPCMDNSEYFSGYPVWATVQHRSGIASAKIHYTTDPAGGNWQTVDLPFYPLDDTTWTHKGFIPQQPANSTVYYYIEATAENGKTVVHPLTAPQGYYHFCVEQSSGTHDVAQAAMRSIYPNPAAAITCIPVSMNVGVEGNLRVYNALGQPVLSVFSGQFPAGESNYFFDAGQLTPGTYFVELQAAGWTTMQKVVVR